MRIAVIGARGNFGRPVVFRLLKEGYKVRALCRDLTRARKHFGDKVEYAGVDVCNLPDLIAALRGCDVVHFNLNLDRISSAEAAAWPGFQNIVDAARVCNISRITGIGGGDPPLNHERDFAFDEQLYGGGKIISQSGLPYTLFYPAWFMEGIHWFIEDGKAIIPGKQRNRYHWIAAADYADRVVKAMTMPGCSGKSFWVHGPESLTIPEAVTRFCNAVHPGMPVEEVAIEVHRKLFPDDVAWGRYMDLMTAMETAREIGDSSEFNRLLGQPVTTLNEFISAHAG